MMAGILLAAGMGTRFGAHKLLHSLPEGVPIGVAAARRLRAGVDEAWAVLRPGDERLSELLRLEGLHIVSCPEAESGMGSSLACGVKAASSADGWVIALGDMPFIKSQTIGAVAHAIASGAALAAPVSDGRRGHPVGFGKAFYRDLLSLRGDQGARELIAAHHERFTAMSCQDPGIFLDIDTRDDVP